MPSSSRKTPVDDRAVCIVLEARPEPVTSAPAASTSPKARPSFSAPPSQRARHNAGRRHGPCPLAGPPQPTVALIATGDELVLPGEPTGPDQIVCSNPFGIAAMIQRAGGQPNFSASPATIAQNWRPKSRAPRVPTSSPLSAAPPSATMTWSARFSRASACALISGASHAAWKTSDVWSPRGSSCLGATRQSGLIHDHDAHLSGPPGPGDARPHGEIAADASREAHLGIDLAPMARANTTCAPSLKPVPTARLPSPRSAPRTAPSSPLCPRPTPSSSARQTTRRSQPATSSDFRPSTSETAASPSPSHTQAAHLCCHAARNSP